MAITIVGRSGLNMDAERRAELETRRASKLGQQLIDGLCERLRLTPSDVRFLSLDETADLQNRVSRRVSATSTQVEAEPNEQAAKLLQILREQIAGAGLSEVAVLYPFADQTGAMLIPASDAAGLASDWPLEWSDLSIVSLDASDGMYLVHDFIDVTNGRRPARLSQLRLWGRFCTPEWDGGPTVCTHSRQGYFLEYGRADPEGFDHVFCGDHDLKGAVCSSCGNRLLRFFSLDTSDPRLELAPCPFESLHLLYCWRCGGRQEYQIVGDSEIRLLEWLVEGPSENFPYEDYLVAFPGAPASLSAVTDVEQRLIQQINRGEVRWYDVRDEHPKAAECRHQFGGEPFLVQGVEQSRICERCSAPRSLAAVVADDCLDPRGFTGNSYVQVLFWLCKGCWSFAVENRCD